jgi:ergothioneine biosynthesis protein EgtB
MATSQLAPNRHSNSLARLEEGRDRTDALFALLPPESFYERPIPERHRLIFYLGHLEAFDRNLLNPALGLETKDAEFDKLFAFGIDPVGGGLPTDAPSDWPSIDQVQNYRRDVRRSLDDSLRNSGQSRVGEVLLNVAIEHRLMHAETLAYLFHNLPAEKKLQYPVAAETRPAPRPRQAAIPAGVATLGLSRESREFGWDNEFDETQIEVPRFSMDVFPVTNDEYLKFVRAGGYETSSYWRPEDWEWKCQQHLEHPHFWVPRAHAATPDARWEYRAMFRTIPLPLSWPVYVSHAEASAFARWCGKKLPTEAQWHRAAYGTPHGVDRTYPWGDAEVDEIRGNFHHRRWHATPVDAHPAGASAFGIHDLLGNGWEWTSTAFGPFPGFEPFPFYRGYSADFFDGKHFVLKGGSQRTDACMLRRSFRNWFQPHYQYLYATFRCVEE